MNICVFNLKTVFQDVDSYYKEKIVMWFVGNSYIDC